MTAGRLERSAGWAEHAFGVQVESDVPVPGLVGGAPRTPRPVTSLTRVGVREIERAWEGASSTRVRDERHPDRSLLMAIDEDPERGYRIDTPGHGQWLVSPDGARVLAAFEYEPVWRWQLVLFAQVLPLVATLRGAELLHASAVAVDGSAYAFVAPSGTGKSSVSMHLVAQGAEFFADDALAVEIGSARVTAHPGGRLVNAHAHELAKLDEHARARLGPVIGTSTKLHLEPPSVRGPLPLAALYFLERRGHDPIAVNDDVDPTMFLANTFVLHVRTPDRMARQLSVCAGLARTVPTRRVRAPTDAEAPEVARFLLDRMERLA